MSRSRALLSCVCQLATLVVLDGARDKPHIVVILCDDLGWANVGYHNADNRQISTPNIDALVADGLELNRFYTHWSCTPSRSAFQTGRLPIHVQQSYEDADGIVTPEHGIPSEMTTIALKLKEANYSTFLVGKWDIGFASFSKIPISKGYDSFYGYFGKNIDYYSKLSDDPCYDVDDRDLWDGETPAHDEVDGNEFVETVFKRKVIEIIEGVDADTDDADPLFLVYASHLPHSPSMVPEHALEADLYADDTNLCALERAAVFPGFDGSEAQNYECRTILQSQVNLLDVYVGELVGALKAQGIWNDTLIVLASDNGGSLKLDETAGNNFPLRGGKGTDFEGGIRAVAVVSGGFLPSARRGQIEEGYVHICDLYATFCRLANVSDADLHAVDHGLPDIDALDLWPLLSGEIAESPRTQIPISNDSLIYGEYKYMKGVYAFAVWQSAVWPRSTTPNQSMLEAEVLDCSRRPCLFNIIDDEEERFDIAHSHPNIVAEMGAMLEKLAEDFFENTESGTDSCPADFALHSEGTTAEYCGCWMAMHNFGGFCGPYQDLEPTQIHFDSVFVFEAEEEECEESAALPILRGARYSTISLTVSAAATTVFVLWCLLHRRYRAKQKRYEEISD